MGWRAAIALLLLAGCVSPSAPLAPLSAAPAADGLRAWDGATLHGASGQRAATLALATCLGAGRCEEPPASCDPSSCERTPILVPASSAPMDLVVRIRWPTDYDLWFKVQIQDASGKVLADGRAIVVDHKGAVARVENAAPGEYVAAVIAITGSGSYQAIARLEPHQTPAGDLLPDLVTLPPTDLQIASPPGTQVGPGELLPGEVGSTVAGAFGAKGCAPEEAAAGARRCLRFSNVVGNVGAGPLEVRLAPVDAATSPAGGRFMQRIFASDGSYHDAPAGPAQFHAIHGHWHNAAANAFSILRYDNATGARGEEVATGRKTGICFADVGQVWNATRALPSRYEGASCFNPAVDHGWSMGIGPGWYDEYDWILSDQYVDVSGLEDGTYLLCARTNAEGTLAEWDTHNDEACVPFALKGDSVTELATKPYYAWP